MTAAFFRQRLGALGACLLAFLGVCVLPVAAQTPEDLEAKVKSAFLLNFARYVEWPTNAFPSSNSPVVIGVLGQPDTLGANLDVTVDGKTVETRPVRVKRARRIADLMDCHVIYFCPSERDRLRPALAAIADKPLLTVSDIDNFTAAGGMIWLKKTRQGTMRFDIEKEVADKAGLKISSKLLKLAENLQR